MKKTVAAAALGLALSTCGFAAAETGENAPLTTVPRVEIERYVGLWYEIAKLPNRFQKGCASNVTAEYSLRDDGRIDVVNRCATAEGDEKRAKGVARIVDVESGAKLEVRFAPAFLSFLSAVWGDYWIIDLAPDYSFAVIGEPARRYLWILARTASLEEGLYREILGRLEDQGYDPAGLVRTPQEPGSTR